MMLLSSGKDLKNNDDSRITRFKILTVFLLASLCAVLLMLTAIYNGANEYAIKNAIQRNFDFVSLKTSMAFSDIDRVLDKKEFITTVQKLSDVELILYPVVNGYPDTIRIADTDLSLASDQFQMNDQMMKSGYFDQQGNIYIWNLITIEDQLYSVLSVSEFPENQNYIMMSVFSNRLIIPSIFIVWLSVWGSLVLSRRLSRLYDRTEALDKLVTLDPLTGLQNKKQADKVIGTLLSKAHRHNQHLPVLLVMINHFSELNEVYGQSFSEALILSISRRLNETLRAYDQILRYRENVFMVILPEETQESSALVEKRLYKELGRQYEIYGHNIQLNLLIDTIIYPDHIAQSDEFIQECNRRIGLMFSDTLNGRKLSSAKSKVD